MRKNVLVVGGGGREHALVWKLHQSPKVGQIYVTSENGGTRSIAKNVSINPTNIKRLIRFAKNSVDLTIVGPEESLELGIVDKFQAKGLRIFGPTKAASRIETSKAFAKQFMVRKSISTAPFQAFGNYQEASNYLAYCSFPIVVKKDGLAAGKGVFICKSRVEAEIVLRELIAGDDILKKMGSGVVIEEFLEGQEISIHAFCDGKTSVLMPPVQDHKPIFDNDKGPNTGGMGAIVPVPWITPELTYRIKQEIVEPALEGLEERGTPFTGCFYPGLKITPSGPRALEFNARFGDPETQCLMRLLQTDLLDIIEACIEGRLSELTIEWNQGFAVCIVLASEGYPGKSKASVPIDGINEAEKIPGIKVFHAGTMWSRCKTFYTSGGRVLGVTALGGTLELALERAYSAVGCIHFEGMQHRKDIGRNALNS